MRHIGKMLWRILTNKMPLGVSIAWMLLYFGLALDSCIHDRGAGVLEARTRLLLFIPASVPFVLWHTLAEVAGAYRKKRREARGLLPLHVAWYAAYMLVVAIFTGLYIRGIPRALEQRAFLDGDYGAAGIMLVTILLYIYLVHLIGKKIDARVAAARDAAFQAEVEAKYQARAEEIFGNDERWRCKT